ncbi:MAG: VOC family protein [Bacteroidota bacterium]
MKYGYTIFYVADVKATLHFYETAFGFAQKFMTPEQDYGELVSGATTIAFASVELGRSNFKKGFQTLDRTALPVAMEIAFVTEDIEADFQRAVDAGATVYEAVVQKPWGQKVGYLRDLNGVLIEICTPVGE